MSTELPIAKAEEISTAIARIEQVKNVVAEYKRVEDGMSALAERHAGVVYDVTTRDGMKAAKAARGEIRDVRLALEERRKEAKAPLLALGKFVDSRAKDLTARLIALEDPIALQIEHEQKREQREIEAREQAERERIAAIEKRIKAIYDSVGEALAASFDRNVEGIKTIGRRVRDTVIDDTFGEYQKAAHEAKETTLPKLLEVLAKTTQTVAYAEALAEERRKADAERAELEALRTAEAERQRVARETLEQEQAAARAKIAAEEAESRRQLEAERVEAARQQAERDAEARRQLEVERTAREAEERQRQEALREQEEAVRLQQAELDRQRREAAEIALQARTQANMEFGEYVVRLVCAEMSGRGLDMPPSSVVEKLQAVDWGAISYRADVTTSEF